MSAFPENPFGGDERIDVDALPLAVVRHSNLRVDDLRAAFDVGYRALGHLIAEGRFSPAGPALAVYRGNPLETFDLEIGFPVTEPLADPIGMSDGTTVHPSALPEGPAIATTFIGDYDGLGAAWGALIDRVAERGASPAGIWIESYVSDPSDTPADELRTDLIMPIEAAEQL